jgi:Replication-relaxation
MVSKRRTRFHRVKDLSPIELTERDKDILYAVYRYRFLRSHQIVQLATGSNQKVLRRLQKLYHHGYLERPLCQLDYFQKKGSHYIVYGLARCGFLYLRKTNTLPPESSDPSAQNHQVKRLFLEHALMISDIMFTMEIECRKSDKIRLLIGEELSTGFSGTGHHSKGWAVTGSGRRHFYVIPDQVFALEFTETKERILCFLEADRGTMPVHRSRLDMSSFERKFLAYESTWQRRLHLKLFGEKRVRVLAVTDSEERATHLRDACTSLQTGKGIFLFSTRDKILKSLQTFADPWTDAFGKTVALAA